MEGAPARLQQTPNLAQGPPGRRLAWMPFPRGRGGLVTTNGVGDGEVLPMLLDQIDDPIAQLFADGDSQVAEVYARVAAMNTMTRLGMPESQPAF
jgi:hypothetical protein